MSDTCHVVDCTHRPMKDDTDSRSLIVHGYTITVSEPMASLYCASHIWSILTADSDDNL